MSFNLGLQMEKQDSFDLSAILNCPKLLNIYIKNMTPIMEKNQLESSYQNVHALTPLMQNKYPKGGVVDPPLSTCQLDTLNFGHNVNWRDELLTPYSASIYSPDSSVSRSNTSLDSVEEAISHLDDELSQYLNLEACQSAGNMTPMDELQDYGDAKENILTIPSILQDAELTDFQNYRFVTPETLIIKRSKNHVVTKGLVTKRRLENKIEKSLRNVFDTPMEYSQLEISGNFEHFLPNTGN
ncbi:hypothetical protein KAFR_0D03840 [Kazachstania africana CBS 2517]|uniref:Uncharacterized protein n=1 Tax=Kazachstania africana (strain ATCC 22294 / BCRC 22015 / CBS 2517 / CECT 1963 / NBRC 1671 / NRRL Y-8276) TaxID=1071382 RepID=H2AUI2_KAZAF|nr:hypothetical protein KAFR_0D03840 [Kazachstania africana CBS 2517]CCF58032.1 hypothetical protein KAFR_0D03840 [Kazachstania africana CBS 2517]